MESLSGVPHPDPLVFELNRLHNQLKEKERELGAAQSEIKAFKATEALKDKAVEELEIEMKRLGEKLGATENLLDQKNLNIMKLTEEKREANYAQYGAEATLRRVHADQKDDSYICSCGVLLKLTLTCIKTENTGKGAIARFKVTANEWKDENDKVMPVKQWLEERRLLQAEMQRLREKLRIVEKTGKAEAQLKDKLKLRLKTVLESGLN